VVLPAREFQRLKRRRRKESLFDFFAASALAGCGVDPTGKPDDGRPVDP
jgi:hypothetical protein